MPTPATFDPVPTTGSRVAIAGLARSIPHDCGDVDRVRQVMASRDAIIDAEADALRRKLMGIYDAERDRMRAAAIVTPLIEAADL